MRSFSSLFNTISIFVRRHTDVFFEDESKGGNGVETKLIGDIRKGYFFTN